MADSASVAQSSAAESGNDIPRFIPPTDIFETKDALVMLLDMPGADPGSLDVTLDKNLLTVSARSTPSVPQGYTLAYGEYRDGNYERGFTLSEQVDGERIDAIFKDGVLRVTLPKAQSATKKIAVKAT